MTIQLVPPEDLVVKPGMAGRATARAELPPEAAGAGVEIPLSALFSPPDDPSKGSYVWVVEPGTQVVRRRAVEVEQLTPEGARVSGLRPGEHVVTVGVHHLREGQAVVLNARVGP